MNDDDAALLRRYAEACDEGAFAELVQRHLALVYGAALRQLNGATHRAEEVSQSVFTDLARKAASLSRRTELAGWLYTSTHFAAAKLKRAEQRRQAREQEAHTMHELLSGSSSEADWERLRPVLDDAMHELGDRDRDVILLRFFRGRRLAELAEKFGLSEDAARMRVDRALEKLRVLLARRQITSTSAALGIVLANQPVTAVPMSLAASVTSSALASAGIAAVPAVSVFHFMSTAKMAAGMAAIAILALGGAIFEASQAREDRAALRSLGEQRDQLQRRIVLLEAQVHESIGRVDHSTAPTGIATAANAPSSTVSGSLNSQGAGISPNALRPSNPLGSLYALRGSPEAMEAWLKAERSGLDLQLGPLFQSLGLSPEQIELFKTIMMEKFQAVADITGTAQSQGLTLSDPAIKAAFKDATDKAEDALRALLGAPGYEQLRQYGATTEVREMVKAVASDVYYSGAPLNAQQADRLVQLIASHSEQSSSGYKLDSTNWPDVFAAAPGFLAPAQIAMLQAERNQLLLRQELDRLAKAAKPPGR